MKDLSADMAATYVGLIIDYYASSVLAQCLLDSILGCGKRKGKKQDKLGKDSGTEDEVP